MSDIVVLDGMARSGTTFFSRVVDAFPGIYLLDDSVRLFHFYALEHEKDFRYPRSMCRLSSVDLNSPFKEEYFPRLKKNIEATDELEPGLKQNLLTRLQYKKSYPEMFSDICEITREYSGSRIVGFKVTHHHRFRDAILDSMPNVKWITIVRDPRAVYSSGQTGRNASIQHVVTFWNDLARSLSPRKRFLYVRYEDLILRKEDAVASIAAFLNIELDPGKFFEDLRLRDNVNKPWFSNSSFGNVTNTHIKAQYFDTGPVRRWEDKLSAIEKYVIRRLCAANMRKLGYASSEKNKGFVREFKDSAVWVLKFIAQGLKKWISRKKILLY